MDGELVGGNVDGVLVAFEHIELGVDRLFESLSFLTKNILGNDLGAGANDSIVRLGGDDESEGLQIGGDVELVFSVVAGKHFAEIDGAAFGSDGPQNISEVLASEAVGGLQVLEFDTDGEASGFAVDLGVSADIRA